MCKQYTASEPYQQLMDGIQRIDEHEKEEMAEISRQLLNKLQALAIFVGQKFSILVELCRKYD